MKEFWLRLNPFHHPAMVDQNPRLCRKPQMATEKMLKMDLLNNRLRIASVGLCLLCLLSLLVIAPVSAQQRHTQQVDLHPGWNAVFLEVQPDDIEIDAAFAGLPVASIWRFIPDTPGADFISDPAEGLLSVNGWYGYFPEPRPEAFLTNLFTLTGNQTYLINLDGSSTVSWTISGKPVLRDHRWAAGAFTLAGFNVAASGAPTFAEYFEGSAAHEGQAIYQLSAAGVWELVNNAATTIDSNRAYWVFTEGGSNFQGPLEVSVDSDGELEFGTAVSRERIVLENNSSVATDVVIRRLGNPNMPLEFELVDPDANETSWPRLPAQLALPIAANGDAFFTVAVRRQDFTEVRMEELLEISNGMGVRKLVFVGADTLQPSIPASVLGDTLNGAKATAPTNAFAGLWIGDARVDKVSEAQLAGVTPEPASGGFPIRLLIHINDDGNLTFLKEVIKLFEEGTFKTSPEDPDFVTTDVPGRYVLVTDESLIPNFTGSISRGGESVGVRYSTVSFDFPEELLALPGTFALDQDFIGTIVIPSTMPTNPFLHRYHPDHDNRDAQFLNFQLEAPELTREFTLNFSSVDPTGADDPAYGSSIIGGTYSEAISGLHRNRIFVEGQFQLRRISSIAVLNQ